MNSKNLPKCFSSLVEHLHFNNCHSRLLELLQMDSAKPLIIVTGPTGIGKTTLLAQLKASATALAAPEMAENPEALAFGGCAVKAHGQTAFSWKDTYVQILRSLQHPFPDSRPPRSVPTTTDRLLKNISPETVHRYTNDRLFRMLQKTIEHRKPKAILLDEAQHLLRVGSSQSLLNQLEHLKYIADETHTPHILFGTYELIRLMDLSSALIRRREVVHFTRYVYDSEKPEDSLEPFAEAVSVFARDFAGVATIDLLDEVPYLYQGCVGCVGVLRQWLFNAYTSALASRSKITKGFLDRTALKAGDKKALLEDILEGEKYFAKQAAGEDEYLQRLGFTETESDSPKKPSGKKNNKPGQRKAHSDPVGIQALDPKKQRAA